MYFIIETDEQFQNLPIIDDCFIQIIQGNDLYHPILNSISLIFYRTKEKGYIFPIKHTEAFSLDIKEIEIFLNKHKRVYLIDKKLHSYYIDLNNSIDLHFVAIDVDNEFKLAEIDTILHKKFYEKYANLKNINEIIPISKHYEKCELIHESIKEFVGLESNLDFENELVKAYKSVEVNGIKIKNYEFEDFFEVKNPQRFIKNDIVYTSYNLYNLTSRPTNSFNGINFLAIPKDNKFRNWIIPKNDYLVEFDFDAYHLRLIAKLINYTWKEESIHTFLAKEYFKKDTISEEEYKESKAITFKQLYGGISEEYKYLEFYSLLDSFIKEQWNLYNHQQFLKLPTGRILRYIDDMNPLKLFNYIIQNKETEENTKKINKLNDYLKDFKSKLVLIVYDSFLIDYSIDDKKECLLGIKEILEIDNFKVKSKHGTNYSF